MTHRELAAAEALLGSVRRAREVRDDRRGETPSGLMVALVRAEVPLRGVAALVQLRRPDLLLALRRLADGAVLSEPGDTLGLHPIVIRPGLPRDRLQ